MPWAGDSPILVPRDLPLSALATQLAGDLDGERAGLPRTEAGLRVAWYRCRTATSAGSSLVTPNSCTRRRGFPSSALKECTLKQGPYDILHAAS